VKREEIAPDAAAKDVLAAANAATVPGLAASVKSNAEPGLNPYPVHRKKKDPKERG